LNQNLSDSGIPIRFDPSATRSRARSGLTESEGLNEAAIAAGS
jgi:hypothetical protein